MTTPTFPNTLPSPDSYTLTPVPQVLMSGESGPMAFRNISRNSGGFGSVSWSFTSDQLLQFEQFWAQDLVRGHKWFLINLPSAVGLSTHTVRFTRHYQSTSRGLGLWTVTAEIEILVRRIKDFVLDLFFTSDIYPLLERDSIQSSIAFDSVTLSPPVYVQDDLTVSMAVNDVILTTLLRSILISEDSITCTLAVNDVTLTTFVFNTIPTVIDSITCGITVGSVIMRQLLVIYTYEPEAISVSFSIDEVSLT